MRGREEILEHHTLVMRDGRILDVLPNATAAERYAPRALLERPAHALIPGMVNARTCVGPLEHAAVLPQSVPGDGLLCIAKLLKAGVTCFCHVGYHPRQAAQTAAAQGMRAFIGLPVAEHPSIWAQGAGDYLTRALSLRDEYKGHPCITTGFAPLGCASLSDATYRRIGMLADELDAAVVMSLHASQNEIDESLAQFGLRPLARLQGLGLLTPLLTAAHMTCADAADIDIAQRGGIGVTLCLESDLARGNGMAPVAALAQAGSRRAANLGGSIPLSVGSDGGAGGDDQDLWTDMKLLTLHSRHPSAAEPYLCAWDALAAATRGGAAVLGLEGEIGTLEVGKWADVCCMDLSVPAAQPPDDPVRRLVFAGGRDMVSDVWIAGRQLLSKGQFTRLDWPDLAARFGIAAAADSLESAK